jgi:flagellar motor switch protein FliN/FliY
VSDDLLKPEEIEALLKAAGGNEPKPGAPPAGPRSEPRRRDSGGTAENIDALVQSAAGARGGQRAARPKTSTERLLEQAQAGLAAAVSGETRSEIPSELGAPSRFDFQPFNPSDELGGEGVGLNALQDVELDLRIELGRTELLIEEVLRLKEGSVVPLNKLAGDPVDILVNGRLIARGEVLVLNDNFCVRIAEIVAPSM